MLNSAGTGSFFAFLSPILGWIGTLMLKDALVALKWVAAPAAAGDQDHGAGGESDRGRPARGWRERTVAFLRGSEPGASGRTSVSTPIVAAAAFRSLVMALAFSLLGLTSSPKRLAASARKRPNAPVSASPS